MSKKSTKGHQTELRRLLSEEFPMMPGPYQGKPAPAHILNKFVYSLLGKGTSVDLFKDAYFSSNEQLDALIAGRARQEIRDDLKFTTDAVFDADRHSYKEFSSYLPVHAGFVCSDPTDDGFGSGLISLLSTEQRLHLRRKLIDLLDPPTHEGDPVSRFAASIASPLRKGLPTPVSEIAALSDPKATSSLLGDGLFEFLSRRLDQVVNSGQSAERIRFLLRMSNFLSAYVCIALLLEGARRDLENSVGPEGLSAFKDDGAGAFLGIPVYCGNPPGPPRDMAVELSHLCLQDLVKRSHQGIRAEFISLIPRSESDLERVVTSRLGGNEAQKVLSVLRDVGAIGDPGTAFSALLSEHQLHQSVKLLGTKVGLLAPRKSAGKSRLVLETTFIDSLAYFVGDDGMRFETFVDQCYRKLGLLIGLPESISDAVLQRLFRISGQSIDLIPVLQSAQEHCRQRLINCGIAQEFSDHATILRLT